MKSLLNSLAKGDHSDPHRLLGGHPYQQERQKGVIIRAFHPDALKVSLLLEGESINMTRIHPGAIFEADLKGRSWPFPYRFRFFFQDESLWEIEDPYRFLPTLGELDLHLINEGNHLKPLLTGKKSTATPSGTAGAIWGMADGLLPSPSRVMLMPNPFC